MYFEAVKNCFACLDNALSHTSSFLPRCFPYVVPDNSVSYCNPGLPANGVPGPIAVVSATFPPSSHIANCATVAANTMVTPPVITEVNSFLRQCVPSIASDINVNYCNVALPVNGIPGPLAGVPTTFAFPNHIADIAVSTANTVVAAPIVAETESFACLDNKLSRTSGLLPRRIPSLVPDISYSYRSPVLSANDVTGPTSGVPAVFQPASQIASSITIATSTVKASPVVAEINRYS
ncbi:uncharacterized protein NPIL_240301 [Nephila pilipes]|uniref:Uncharacterized protein n=1 Tax=Nephila pilipes TaxID=299642 RepID=A0A8X6MG85_NEPPI|nr:uncharacterized protein NPIL_240301 [Nephila pilipes]